MVRGLDTSWKGTNSYVMKALVNYRGIYYSPWFIVGDTNWEGTNGYVVTHDTL
jgi:hypothetical protein